MGCLSCEDGRCQQCWEGLTLFNGQCLCSVETQKLNPQGECEECRVSGCESCASGHPDTCVKCTDCSAILMDGQCSCNFPGAIFNDFGFCTTPEENETLYTQHNLRNKKTSTFTQGHCSEYQGGKCKACQEGHYLLKDRCVQCPLKCSSCSSGRNCSECKAGFWLSERRTCEKCMVLHCADCQQSQKECTKCKEGFELVEEKCERKQLKTSAAEGEAEGEMSWEEFKKEFGKVYKSK